MFSGLASSSTSCTQSRTAWFCGRWSPISRGGEMAGARLFMNTIPNLQDVVLRDRASDEFHPFRAVLQEIFVADATGIAADWPFAILDAPCTHRLAAVY